MDAMLNRTDGSIPYRRARVALLGGSLLLLQACAGSTVGSGVGDLVLERPPYYSGRLEGDSGRVGHLPLLYQRGASQEPVFDPGQETGSPLAKLLADMNAYLDSLTVTTRVEAGSPPSDARGPDVQFGCLVDVTGDCENAGGATSNSTRVRMRLAVTRPSTEWTMWAHAAAENADVQRLLLLTLEVGQYWPRQRNLLGAKELELGTGYTLSLPWLTSLDDPVNVVQLTGALLDGNGRALRIGAEGMLARRTGLPMSALGAQRLITNQDIEQLRTERREDLPGKPLVWQTALHQLVRGLTGGAFD